jgi:hypothetical protein
VLQRARETFDRYVERPIFDNFAVADERRMVATLDRSPMNQVGQADEWRLDDQ